MHFLKNRKENGLFHRRESVYNVIMNQSSLFGFYAYEFWWWIFVLICLVENFYIFHYAKEYYCFSSSGMLEKRQKRRKKNINIKMFYFIQALYTLSEYYYLFISFSYKSILNESQLMNLKEFRQNHFVVLTYAIYNSFLSFSLYFIYFTVEWITFPQKWMRPQVNNR